MRFVDTNVLLYSISGVETERRKRDVARELLACRDLVLSVQVLQEFYVQATRARRHALSHVTAVELIHAWRRFPVQELTVGVMEAALEITRLHRISYWDAAIVAAASAAGCAELLTEDLQHGARLAGIAVRDPFRLA